MQHVLFLYVQPQVRIFTFCHHSCVGIQYVPACAYTYTHVNTCFLGCVYVSSSVYSSLTVH